MPVRQRAECNGTQRNTQQPQISRFGRSRDDFCFFLEPKKPDLVGASTSEEVEEELELIGVDGDCKEVAQEHHKSQIIANMNKCAADIAYSAIKKGILFNKISVFGLLVDYI